MPSPIAHSAAGYLIHRLTKPDQAKAKFTAGLFSLRSLALVTFSLLPDLDAIPGQLTGQMADFHNNLTHSFLVGLAVAFVFAIVASRFTPQETILSWWMLSFSAYGLHLLMDIFTMQTRGLMLFWPLTEQRFEAPFKLFYGVRWGNGMFHVSHLWTVFTELATVSLILLVVYLWKRFRSPQDSPRRSTHQE